MRKLFILFDLLVWCVVFGHAHAQQMRLDDCVQYALLHNLALGNKTIDSKIAKEKQQQARRDFLPRFDVGSTAAKRFGRSIDPTTNAFVDQSFFTMNFYLQGQIELFSGFAQVNQLQYEKLRYLMSLESMAQERIDIGFKVMQAYYDVVYFSSLADIMAAQVGLSQLNVAKTEKQIALGLKSESDLLEIKAQEASEAHKYQLVLNDRDKALLALKTEMNYPVADSLQLLDTIVCEVMLEHPSAQEVYAQALRVMPIVQKASLETQAAKKQFACSIGHVLPTLSLGFNMGTNYADYQKVGNKDHLQTVPFVQQWQQNMSRTIYLSIGIPLFHQGRGLSAIKTAKLEYRKAQNNEEETKIKLLNMVTADVTTLHALQKEEALLQAKQLAMREAFTIAQKKLDKGLINVLDFYTSKNQLAQAEAELMRVRIQRLIKAKTIDIYMGKTLK